MEVLYHRKMMFPVNYIVYSTYSDDINPFKYELILLAIILQLLPSSLSGWSKQASKHTHTHAQCSHTSVGLVQARTNNSSIITSIP